ncbi:HAD family hydrolase, partial [Streptomyces coelicoflavus]|nr:HAD family hydrolase [Streptomyces coelicoflavus]
SGPCDADELRAAGADVVLTGLTDFPRWLAAYRDGEGDAEALDAARA